MKVLALNSSPRSQGQSKTELMLSHLVEGMKEAGADVEVVNLREKKIKPCSGCFACWTKTPGVCIHKDDMSAELFDKYRRSDMAVFASPLYHYRLNSVMKKFIERTLPMNEPFFVEHEGRTHHPVRYPYPKTVILSVAGFHEPEIFGPLSVWANYVYKHVLAADIYRPGAEAMAVLLFLMVLVGNKENTAVATIIQYQTPHTARLRRRPSDEPLCGAHSRAAAGPTDVLETSINYLGISVYPGIYRMTQICFFRRGGGLLPFGN